MRHQAIDRAYHWLNALAVVVLMFTGFLPKVGFNFNWIDIHWLSGVFLICLTLFHIYRAIFKLDTRSMNIGLKDFNLDKNNKYNLLQKLVHIWFSVLILLIIISGIVMAFKADVIGVNRNPYILEEQTWGWIYLLHGLVSVMLLAFTMIHIYFNLRKENRAYLRSMLFNKRS
jgi:formate dehydrogenase subunit gamma